MRRMRERKVSLPMILHRQLKKFPLKKAPLKKLPLKKLPLNGSNGLGLRKSRSMILRAQMKETPAEAIPAYDSPAPTGETLTGEVRGSEKRPKSEHIRIRVSSKHLILASHYFRSILRGDFKEGVDLRTTKVTEIPLVEDHPAALLILLNIIYGHTRRVPRAVDFRILTRIAVLVDKYQFHEVAEMFTNTWVEKLRGSMPTSLTDDLRAAICIYWVFRKSSEFKRVTQIALMDSNDTKSLILNAAIGGWNVMQWCMEDSF
jgi:hypothetical protein